jgi:hypothetical protein
MNGVNGLPPYFAKLWDVNSYREMRPQRSNRRQKRPALGESACRNPFFYFTVPTRLAFPGFCGTHCALLDFHAAAQKSRSLTQKRIAGSMPPTAYSPGVNCA